ncbi:unnamed protein product [Calypogeia fissa]
MSFKNLDLNFLPEEGNVGSRSEGYEYVGMLYKDQLLVSPIAVRHLPISLPPILRFSTTPYASYYPLSELPSFELVPHQLPPPATDQRGEWRKFTTFLHERNKVVIIPVDGWELILKPPVKTPNERTSLRVCYRKLNSQKAFDRAMSPISRPFRPRGEVLDPPVRGHGNVFSSNVPVAPTSLVQPRLGLMHPTYLRTLAQTHASWAFGGIAELVDNARDAHATRINISITTVKMKGKQDLVPVLKVEDNGNGMTHAEFARMLSFGHSTPTDEDKNQIGHFGVGFKTGSMKIGSDVVVLTQCENSRSIGLLSASYNADKEVLEVPIVTYRKVHGIMEMDLSVQSEAEGQACLEAVKRYSPYGEFEIGSLFEMIGNGDSKNGTHIFIYNLEKWGSDYTLQWDTQDIIIRSKRVRTRPGQTRREISLDYSLRSYLEVLFLDPCMIIKIQGSKVATKRLAASLSKTQIAKGKVLGKQVELTLGRSSEEYRNANCGVFLYWHGRLIEAYKRVGGMVHSADMGRGVIGVIDVTPLMENTEGRIGVLNTKQGFEDSEEYAHLEKWLADEFNSYWDRNFDKWRAVQKVDAGLPLEPDREWVQCDKCRKWRKLPRGVHPRDLPEEWFCYFEPFRKTCNEPEEKVEEDIVTIGVNRTSMPAIVSTEREALITASGENLEDDVEELPSPVVPTRRQSTRKSLPKDPSPTRVRAGKRQSSESPPRRRLRKRN